jgi:hypothetical protein
MKLSSATENYVALSRSLGAVFSVDARILRSFSRAVGDVPLQAITPEDCRRFCRGKGLPTRFWERKYQTLHGFFRYLVSRGFLVSSPFKEPSPRIQHTFRPYIYSHDELGKLLEATTQERNSRTRLEPETLRTMVLLLYGAGLRVGEALRLHCGCAIATSIYNTECFQSGTRSSSSRGCSPSEQAWPPRLPATLNSVNMFSRRMNTPPTSFRPGLACRFGFGRSRSHSCVCGSGPGFDDPPQTIGNLGFMISARPLQFIAWSPGIVRAQTFRSVCPCWPPTWDM